MNNQENCILCLKKIQTGWFVTGDVTNENEWDQKQSWGAIVPLRQNFSTDKTTNKKTQWKGLTVLVM